MSMYSVQSRYLGRHYVAPAVVNNFVIVHYRWHWRPMYRNHFAEDAAIGVSHPWRHLSFVAAAVDHRWSSIAVDRVHNRSVAMSTVGSIEIHWFVILVVVVALHRVSMYLVVAR